MARWVLVVLASILTTLALTAPAQAAAAPAARQGCQETAVDGTRHTFVCDQGPFEVAGYAVRQEITGNVPVPPIDGGITDMAVDVVDRQGRPIPIQRLMLHHIVFSNLGGTVGERHDATCDQITGFNARDAFPAVVERFYAAGEERAEMHLPPGYGYATKATDSWALTWMFMNHRPTTDRGWIRYTVTVDTAPTQPVTPYWMDVANCNADPIYDVPGGGAPGTIHRRSAEVVLPRGGRIVAAGGHVHGGGRALRLTEPDCDNRQLVGLRPAWGRPDHPFYNVKPILHEPGPIAMDAVRSARGIGLPPGARLRLESDYDASRPHTRVMGISVVMVAEGAAPAACAPLPADLESTTTKLPHRTQPPVFTVPLTGLDARGRARTISRPPGATRRTDAIRVGDNFFRAANAQVPAGTTVTWRFGSRVQLHNVTVADGPRGFSSPNLDAGRTFRRRLTVPGTYRLFCALHPVSMTSTVTVTRRKPVR
jgi:plastocyanin